jgi:hypothetical protein
MDVPDPRTVRTSGSISWWDARPLAPDSISAEFQTNAKRRALHKQRTSAPKRNAYGLPTLPAFFIIASAAAR